MHLRENIRHCLESLFHQRLRTLLTMLGIIIGVASVVLLTSIGEGMKQQITAQIEDLGADLLYVFPGAVKINPKKYESKLGIQNHFFGTGKNTLTYDDVLQLKQSPEISAVTAIYQGIDRLDELGIFVSTTGTDEDYTKIRKLNLLYGRFFIKNERLRKEAVAVIGDQANREIFDGKNSIGQTFHLNGKPYRVIGILRYKKPVHMGPQSEDLNVRIYLPVTEMAQRSKQKNIEQIMVRARSTPTVASVENTVNRILRKVHQETEFTVLKQEDLLETVGNILGILTAALGGIAAISLIVGGIGIMNIMLVAISERTREIGVRKALGATGNDILRQFLLEATVLGLAGGLVGLVVGIGGAKVLHTVLPQINTAISLPAAAAALISAFFVGGFFGVYPAARAARLEPVEALRRE